MRSTTLANVAILLATASCARQKYKGAPPEALHTAILHGGGVEGVDHELKRGAKLKGRDAQSRTALHAAASIGDAEVAAALVKKFAAKGLDLLDAGDANNATALIYACVERKWLSPAWNNGAGRRLSCPAGGLRLHVAQRLLDHAVEAVLKVGAQHFGRHARFGGGGRLVGWGGFLNVGHCSGSARFAV